MARQDDITGKKTLYTKTSRHKHSEGWKYRAQNKPKQQKVNLRKATVLVNGKKKRVRVSMKTYKKLAKEGKIIK